MSRNKNKLIFLNLFTTLFLLFLLLLGIGTVTQFFPRANTTIPVHALLVSSSKLGIFIINGSNGANNIVSSGPRVIKVMDPQSNSSVMNDVRTYKQKYPDGIVVVRFYEGDAPTFNTGDNPQSSADKYFNIFLKPKMNSLGSDAKLFDYISGPNEYGNTPAINTSSDAQWSSRFWIRLSDLIAGAGFHPLMGEIPVGNFDPALMPDLIPALQRLKELGGAWSYHAYSDEYTTDENIEKWYSLRYRFFYDYLNQNNPELSDLPMILTEGGIDHTGNGSTDGWNGTIPPRGDKGLFENWLTWYDGEIQKDPYILGVTLFQIGDSSNWRSFDLEPISDWLSNYLGGQPTVNNPTLPPVATTVPSPTPLLAANSPTPPNKISPTAFPSPVPTAINPSTPLRASPQPTTIYSPTPVPCKPNWCFIKQSECCFDPICVIIGKIGKAGNRCQTGRNYSDTGKVTYQQSLFEQLKNLFLGLITN